MKTALSQARAADDNHKRHAAALDARHRNNIHRCNHTDLTKTRAERVRWALELVYHNPTIYVSYRKKFIAVKVEAPVVVKNRHALVSLEDEWTQLGYTKLVTAQGVIYRIPA